MITSRKITTWTCHRRRFLKLKVSYKFRSSWALESDWVYCWQQSLAKLHKYHRTGCLLNLTKSPIHIVQSVKSFVDVVTKEHPSWLRLKVYQHLLRSNHTRRELKDLLGFVWGQKLLTRYQGFQEYVSLWTGAFCSY